MKSILTDLMSIFLLMACTETVTAPSGKDTWVNTRDENSISCTINDLDRLSVNGSDVWGTRIYLDGTSHTNYSKNSRTTHCSDGVSFYISPEDAPEWIK